MPGRRFALHYADVPLHDLNRDYVLLAEQHAADAVLKEKHEKMVQQLVVSVYVCVVCVGGGGRQAGPGWGWAGSRFGGCSAVEACVYACASLALPFPCSWVQRGL